MWIIFRWQGPTVELILKHIPHLHKNELQITTLSQWQVSPFKAVKYFASIQKVAEWSECL